MTPPIKRLLAKLPSTKRNGRGWVARCPAHDDRRPSLSIAEADDGRVLLHCFAGCKPAAICAAMGMNTVDLFPERGNGYTRGITSYPHRGRKQVRKRPARPATTYTTARDAVASLESRLGKRSASWTYHDLDGQPVGVVLRWDAAEGKEIRPVSRTDAGWVIKAMPTPRPLYGLPELAKADRVFITEGEKAADAARSLGWTATTSAGGSEAPHQTDWHPLAGKECVLLPDNDEAGRRYVDEVAAILAMLTPASVVKIVALPDLPIGGDIADLVGLKGGDR